MSEITLYGEDPADIASPPVGAKTIFVDSGSVAFMAKDSSGNVTNIEQALSDDLPQPTGTASAGTGTAAARDDHVHAIGSGSIGTTAIADGAVTNPKLANMSGNTVKGNSSASSGTPGDISVSAQSLFGRGAGNITSFVIAANQFAARASTGDLEAKSVVDNGLAILAGATTVGTSFATLANPSATTFPRINADSSVTLRLPADFRSDLGLGTLAVGNNSGDVPNASGVSGSSTTDALNTLNAAIAAAVAGAQPLNTNLTAYAALATTGFVDRTGSGTVATRTLTGTTNQISITNGGGGGNPVFSTPQNIDTAANTTFGSMTLSGSSNALLGITAAFSNGSGSQFCIDALLVGTATSNGTYNAQTGRNIMRPDIRSGITNNGTLYSYRYFARRNDLATDEGTLTAFTGLGLDYGHNNVGAVTPTTTTLHGLDMQPYIRTGTITTMYDLRIRAPLTGITPGTYWGISQESSTPNNQILAKTAFGHALGTAPTALVDVAASSTARASLRVRSGTAPSAPNSGDIWYDGTDVVVQESIKSTATTAATSTTTGSGIFGGGLGVAGAGYFGAQLAIANTSFAFSTGGLQFGDLDTGFYESADDVLKVRIAGSDEATWTSTGLAVARQITQNSGLNVGYLEIPQNAQTGNYTAILTDSGKHIFHNAGDGAGDTYTIPANASVAYPLGTTLTFVNRDTNTVSIAITSDTMYLGGTTTTGTRTLAENGVATAIKVSSTVWIISGAGLS